MVKTKRPTRVGSNNSGGDMIFDINFERVQNKENKIQVSIAKYTKKGMQEIMKNILMITLNLSIN